MVHKPTVSSFCQFMLWQLRISEKNILAQASHLQQPCAYKIFFFVVTKQQMNIKLCLKLADSSNRNVQYACDGLWEQNSVSYMSANGLQDKERDMRATKMTEIVGSHRLLKIQILWAGGQRPSNNPKFYGESTAHYNGDNQVLHGDLEKRKICTKLHTPRSLTCKQQEHSHKCARFTMACGH
jgi:hypothetical protein